MATITTEQAYAAMFFFLEDLYSRTKSDEIGGLLGGMAFLNDGRPSDPAIWTEWQRAVEKAVKDGVVEKLDLSE